MLNAGAVAANQASPEGSPPNPPITSGKTAKQPGWTPQCHLVADMVPTPAWLTAGFLAQRGGAFPDRSGPAKAE